MIKIIKKRRRVKVVEYRLDFRWRGSTGGGFSFPCDKHGNVDVSALEAPARLNLERCIRGEYDVIPEGVTKREWSYTEHAVGRCKCGAKVTLAHFTNTCPVCGRDYNSLGQELAPRDQWGWDTGESLGDILRIP